MNDQLQGAVASMLGSLQAGAQMGFDFLKAEIPDFIQEILRFKVAEAIVFLVFFTVVSGGMGLLGAFFWTRRDKVMVDYDGTRCAIGLAICLWCFAAIILLIAYPINIMTIIKINLAPKLYLLEELKNILK